MSNPYRLLQRASCYPAFHFRKRPAFDRRTVDRILNINTLICSAMIYPGIQVLNMKCEKVLKKILGVAVVKKRAGIGGTVCTMLLPMVGGKRRAGIGDCAEGAAYDVWTGWRGGESAPSPAAGASFISKTLRAVTATPFSSSASNDRVYFPRRFSFCRASKIPAVS